MELTRTSYLLNWAKPAALLLVLSTNLLQICESHSNECKCQQYIIPPLYTKYNTAMTIFLFLLAWVSTCDKDQVHNSMKNMYKATVREQGHIANIIIIIILLEGYYIIMYIIIAILYCACNF